MNAPPFTLPDAEGTLYSLSDYRGKWVVIYFYPKDDTPGCTREACGFRDSISEFEKNNVTILGVSKDSVSSHKKFSQKHALNFPILSDESLSTIKAYEAHGEKKFMGKVFQGILRKTVIINPAGEIVKTYEKVNPIFHANELLKDIALLTS